MTEILYDMLAQKLARLPAVRVQGRIAAVDGVVLRVRGLRNFLAYGDRCMVTNRRGDEIIAEVAGFDDDHAILLPYGSIEGVARDAPVTLFPGVSMLHPDVSWRGRVIDAFGNPIDDGAPLHTGTRGYALTASPPPSHKRRLWGGRMPTGVRALDSFVPCCRGQRLGVFAGSGIGKSMLLSMITRHAEADTIVIGLIGERGREVRDFIENTLRDEGLKRAVLVVATAEQPALTRRLAARTVMTIAEYFRDRGDHVLCLFDSMTRVAMAQREIGLATGELPATRGYPPSVFSELPKLVERAGPGADTHEDTDSLDESLAAGTDNKDDADHAPKAGGDITAYFTVLVEGDDTNEPITDCLRGHLDGHVILSRALANRGYYPAIDVLKSLSRSYPDCHAPETVSVIDRARRLLSDYADMEDLIRIGAYSKGMNPSVDEAIAYHDVLDGFLQQRKDDCTPEAETLAQLAALLTPAVKKPAG